MQRGAVCAPFGTAVAKLHFRARTATVALSEGGGASGAADGGNGGNETGGDGEGNVTAGAGEDAPVEYVYPRGASLRVARPAIP